MASNEFLKNIIVSLYIIFLQLVKYISLEKLD